ncbi:MAG: type II toxin-antitoxin system ParD family antitoxin [Amphiplicatus sp.]
MIRKTISLPDEMGAYIERRIRAGQYGNDSEYFRDLVRRDQERQEAVAAIQTLIDEAEASGVSELTLDEAFEQARRRAAAPKRA